METLSSGEYTECVLPFYIAVSSLMYCGAVAFCFLSITYTILYDILQLLILFGLDFIVALNSIVNTMNFKNQQNLTVIKCQVLDLNLGVGGLGSKSTNVACQANQYPL